MAKTSATRNLDVKDDSVFNIGGGTGFVNHFQRENAAMTIGDTSNNPNDILDRLNVVRDKRNQDLLVPSQSDQ